MEAGQEVRRLDLRGAAAWSPTGRAICWICGSVNHARHLHDVGGKEPQHSGQLLQNCAVKALKPLRLAHDLPIRRAMPQDLEGTYVHVSGFGDEYDGNPLLD